MNSVSRAKATIEELKKLFSKGRKPSEDDFARLIDTLNDEADLRDANKLSTSSLV